MSLTSAAASDFPNIHLRISINWKIMGEIDLRQFEGKIPKSSSRN
jgi:hypothetical protein